jgi:hypothetical protein
MKLNTIENQNKWFWSKINKKSEFACWEWIRGTDTNGYGKVRFRKHIQMAHRVAWILTHGEITNKLIICHSCDNPPCCNPDHLFLGTHLDNAHDKIKKGRDKHRFLYGDNHQNTTISDKDILRIRELYSTGKFTYKKLGKLFGCTFQHIGAIILRKRRESL